MLAAARALSHVKERGGCPTIMQRHTHCILVLCYIGRGGKRAAASPNISRMQSPKAEPNVDANTGSGNCNQSQMINARAFMEMVTAYCFVLNTEFTENGECANERRTGGPPLEVVVLRP
jgi:hypothetical protein